MARMKTERPKQQLPEEMLVELLALVRHQFCPDATAREWGQMSNFIKVKVLMWPAAFIRGKNFTLPVEQYSQIMREILMGVKRHGQTATIHYMPGYLMKCVQEHWRIHWVEYYEKSKSVTTIADAAIVGLARTPIRTGPTVEPIAAAHAVLTARARKPKSKPQTQLSLI